MMNLSKENITKPGNTAAKQVAELMQLPEKVLQFGTGVLLRGLPDYFIDKANKQGIFNGRIVIIKSTDGGDFDAFKKQDGLYIQAIRGIEEGKPVQEDIINASVSRVLSAKAEWEAVMLCATDPAIEIIISNTTEVGIQMPDQDDLDAAPPVSFPAKLLALMYKRFQVFNGDLSKGWIILPTELIISNADKLKQILLELAERNKLPHIFMTWLQYANTFCNTLVDRIVPGKLSATDKSDVETATGFSDELMIIAESYALWAIESVDEKVNEILSFAKADSGVVIAPNINKFRELKLRLLNGTHTFTSGLAHIAGIKTVKEAMDNPLTEEHINDIMIYEIAPQIVSDEITRAEAEKFARQVLDRFRNPRVEHFWLNITVQYSSKMKMRNIPLLLKHYSNSDQVPELIAAGFAAHLLFMKCEKDTDGKYYGNINNASYLVQDDNAAWYADKWQQYEAAEIVANTLGDVNFWDANLGDLPGFLNAVQQKLNYLINGDIAAAVEKSHTEKTAVK